jgi:hypothetical protein
MLLTWRHMSIENTENTENTNKLTAVKTVYARAVLLLLAFNFCLTAYVVVNLNNTTQDMLTNASTMTPTKEMSSPENQTLQTREQKTGQKTDD